MKNGMLNVREAAIRLNIGMGYLYKLLWEKKLAGHKAGNRWLVSEAAVEARRKQLGKANA